MISVHLAVSVMNLTTTSSWTRFARTILLIFRRRDCRAVHCTTSFRCNCRCICTPHACKSHTCCPSVSDKDRKASCIYGSNRKLVCTRISFGFFLPAVKGWQQHLGTALGNSRSWGNCARPVRKKKTISISIFVDYIGTFLRFFLPRRYDFKWGEGGIGKWGKVGNKPA